MGAYSEIVPSQRQYALDFISDDILEQGGSPAMGEIAGALGVSHIRAKALIKKLAFETMIERGAVAVGGYGSFPQDRLPKQSCAAQI